MTDTQYIIEQMLKMEKRINERLDRIEKVGMGKAIQPEREKQ